MDIFLNIKTMILFHYKTNRVEKGHQHLTVRMTNIIIKGDCLDQKLVFKGPKHELFDFFYTVQACTGR
jgi:hypothetical protein